MIKKHKATVSMQVWVRNSISGIENGFLELVDIGVGSNSILEGLNVIYTAIAAICAACMNINKVSRVKYWGGPGLPPWFLRL